MTSTVWRSSGAGVIVGGEAGSLLAGANLFATLAAEGMDRYNRRVQRAIELQARRDAGEEIDEVDTEFLERFLRELADYRAKGAVSAQAAIDKRAARRRHELEGKAAEAVHAKFEQWKRDNGFLTASDGAERLGTFIFSVFVFYMGLSIGGQWVLKLLS